MGKAKKIVAGVLVTALIAGGAATGLSYMKKNNQKEILVASVGSLASEYYSPSTTLDGNITTSVSQNINVDKDMIIQEIYVQEGDSVKKGDRLISFDMTLVEMELNIAKLKNQKLKQDLKKAQKRLSSLENGGPVKEDDIYDPGIGGDLGGADSDSGDEDDMLLGDISSSVGGHYLASVMQPVLLAALTDGFGEFSEGGDASSEEPGSMPEEGSFPLADSAMNQYDTPSEEGFGDGGGSSAEEGFVSGEESPLVPEPTPTPEVPPGFEYFDPGNIPGDPGFTDGDETFYQILDFDTEPFEGEGTKENPYIFLCSGAKGYVTATGAFLNKMAGYNADGTEVIQEGGYWYQLEFHERDTIYDYMDRKKSCTGYYLVEGRLLKQPVDRFAELDFTLDDASTYTEIPEEPDFPDFPDIPGGGAGLSRADAIRIQKNRISNLKLDVQESDINIAKLEKKVSRQLITSKLDGTVSTVGDPLTGDNPDGNAFMTIKSKDGFYVKGTAGELILDKVAEGTILKCTSYSYMSGGAGEFEAEVVDVSDYPVGGNNYYFGNGNPNVSSYSFTAVIPDKSVKVQDGEYVNIMLAEDAKASGIVLSKAFVRSKDGASYVYKDDNGILKKQAVTIGGNVEGGYSVLIKGGITREDKIAFPYAKSVKEGLKTKEASLEEFYGY